LGQTDDQKNKGLYKGVQLFDTSINQPSSSTSSLNDDQNPVNSSDITETMTRNEKVQWLEQNEKFNLSNNKKVGFKKRKKRRKQQQA